MSRSANNTGDSAARLAALREEIDAVDAALHDLVMRRARLTLDMGALKGSQSDGTGPVETGNPIRPAREAAILRRLAARHSGQPPFDVVVQVWRELIAANLRRQCAFELAVVETGDGLLWDTARAAFGTLTKATACFWPHDVIDAIASAPGTLGILPSPAGAVPELQMWPELLAGEGAPRILCALPALAGDPWPLAFAVGHAPAEASGEDLSLVLLTSRSFVPDTGEIREAGLKGRIEATWPAVSSPGLYCSFAALDGFILPSDPALARLDDLRRKDGGRATLIGAVPAPIHPPRE